MSVVTALLGAFTGLYTSYAGSKAPVDHFTRGVAKELADKKISVNAVAPGPMDTRELSNYLNFLEAEIVDVRLQLSSMDRRHPKLLHFIQARAWVEG